MLTDNNLLSLISTITFSIPTYNDGKTIENLVLECISLSEKLKLNFKILIVEDGSQDNTREIVKRLHHQHSFLEVIYHEENKGFGPTLREVFTTPDSEWICFLPGDYQFSPTSFMKEATKYIQDYDFILGKRINRAEGFKRKIVSLVYNGIISVISKRKVSDVNSIVLFKREVIENSIFKSKSAFIHAELFIHAKKSNFQIMELPIEHLPRAHGKPGGNKFLVIWKTIIDLSKYIYLQRIFSKK